MITLTLKEEPAVPLEAESLCPDVMAGLSHEAIGALPVFLGKHQRRLDDFFEVDGEASDELVIRGDASKVKWIGRGMTRGRIAIDGNAGMHLGAYMKGGTIEVSGAASDWVGAEMSGGLIRIAGNAGGQSPGASLEATLFSVARRSGPLRTGSSVPADGTRMARSMRMPGGMTFSASTMALRMRAPLPTRVRSMMMQVSSSASSSMTTSRRSTVRLSRAPLMTQPAPMVECVMRPRSIWADSACSGRAKIGQAALVIRKRGSAPRVSKCASK